MVFDHLSPPARRRLAVGLAGVAAVPLLLAGCSNANPTYRPDTVPSPGYNNPYIQSPGPVPIVRIPAPGVGGPEPDLSEVPGTQYPRGAVPAPAAAGT